MITYKDSGVNIEEGYRSVKLIKEYAKKTMGEYVLNGLGSFAGMVELPSGYEKPVLVSGTDGVGTKIDIACKKRKYDSRYRVYPMAIGRKETLSPESRARSCKSECRDA